MWTAVRIGHDGVVPCSSASRGSCIVALAVVVAAATTGCSGELGGCTRASLDVIDEIKLTEADAAAAPIFVGHLRAGEHGLPERAVNTYLADPDAPDDSSREILYVGTDDDGAIHLDLSDELASDHWQTLIFQPTTLRMHFQPVASSNGVTYCWADAEIPIDITRDPSKPPLGTPQIVPELPQVTQAEGPGS